MDNQESFDSAQDKQQNAISNEGQEVNQTELTPPPPQPSRKKLIIGFAVVSALVVGILVAYIVVDSLQPRSRPGDAKRVSDFKQLVLALEFYYDSNGSYPVGDYETIGQTLVSSGFITQPPEDYLNKRGQKYTYASDSSGNSYVLRVELEHEQHLALEADMDGTILEQDCNDPYYCVGYLEKVTSENVSTSEWKTYRNEEYGFEIRHPADLKSGISDNSVLGTVQSPVPGIYIGPIIFVKLDELTLIRAEKSLSRSINVAESPGGSIGGNGLSISCRVEHIPGISEAVSCGGEGGPNFHAIIEDKIYIHILAHPSDFEDRNKILSTFKFIEPQVDTEEIAITRYELKSIGKFGESYDQELILNDENGTSKVIIKSVKNALPHLKERWNYILTHLSFPDSPTRLYFVEIYDSTDSGNGPIWAYDLENDTFKKLESSRYFPRWGKYILSPNGKSILSTTDRESGPLEGIRKLYLIDLEHDSTKTIVDLQEGETLENEFDPFTWGFLGDFAWIDDSTVKYGVFEWSKYDRNETLDRIPFSLIEERQITVN